MTDYPDDADGAVLAELAAGGVDMTQPLLFEFPVLVPDEESARQTLAALTAAGYEADMEVDQEEFSDEDEPLDEDFEPLWSVYAIISMVPEYDEIIRIQGDLDRLANPFGGKSDGWAVMLDDGSEE